MESGVEASWLMYLEELLPTKIVDQLVDWITNPPSVEEVPNTNCLVVVFPGNNKNYGRPDPGIN